MSRVVIPIGPTEMLPAGSGAGRRAGLLAVFALPLVVMLFFSWAEPASGATTTGEESREPVRAAAAQASVGADQPELGSAALASVSTGWLHTCGLRTDGSASCWGSDSHGQAAPPDGTFASVSAGWLHTCGVQDRRIPRLLGPGCIGGGHAS